MKIWTYCVGWNEEKILPYYLKHYLSFSERLIYFDNHSTDKSVEIVRSFPNTVCIPFDTKGFENEPPHMAIHLKIMEIKNNAWKQCSPEVDFVCVSDIDEFIYCDTGLLGLFDKCKRKGYTVLKSAGYEMVSHEFPNDYSKSIFEQVKTGARCIEHHEKSLCFDPKKVNINYSSGCHNCEPAGEVKIYSDPFYKNLHYKMLGLKYLNQRHHALAERLSSVHGNGHHHPQWGQHYMQSDQSREIVFNQVIEKSEVVVK